MGAMEKAGRWWHESGVGDLPPRAASLLLLTARLRRAVLLPLDPGLRLLHDHLVLERPALARRTAALALLRRHPLLLAHPPLRGARPHHAPPLGGIEERVDRGADDGAGDRGPG